MASKFYETVPIIEGGQHKDIRIRGSHVTAMETRSRGFHDRAVIYFVVAIVRGYEYVVASGFSSVDEANRWKKENFK